MIFLLVAKSDLQEVSGPKSCSNLVSFESFFFGV
jgi:hypothetical protein